MMSARMRNSVRGISLALGLALCASACSTIADLDPTGLIGGDSPAPADNAFPDDGTIAPPQASDADLGTTPDLASLPARPAQSATPGQQAQTAQSLASDGAQARYSAEQLRGGTEASAPPPGAATAPNAAAMQQAMATPPTANAPAAAPAPAQAQTAMASPPPAAAPSASDAVPQSAPVARAVEPRRPGAEPAVPANTPVRGGGASMVASDAVLGFRPSAAPPLNSSINQWVSAPIVARYRQTASNAGVANAAVPAVPGAQRDSVSSSVTASIAAISGGMAPTAVVFFAGDGASLTAAGRTQIRAAVNAFKADGGMGTIRVVGHASSRTPNMSVEKHLETIFAKSQARANAVAQELIHQGVPAGRVLVEAVGDSQPVYFESMPKGEDGNRRTEIYVQS